MTDYLFGDTNEDAKQRRGWFIGHFMPQGDLRHRSEVDVRWGLHPQGEYRAKGWAYNKTATTVSILIRGKFRFYIEGEQPRVLQREGEYVMWGPKVKHFWMAQEESLILTVRWPSTKDDSVDCPELAFEHLVRKA